MKEVQENQDVDGMMLDSKRGANQGLRIVRDDFDHGGWRRWESLQLSNCNYDRQKLKQEARQYLMQEHQRSPGAWGPRSK